MSLNKLVLGFLQPIYIHKLCLWWMLVCVGGFSFMSVTDLVCFRSSCWVLISTICRNGDLWWRWLGPTTECVCVCLTEREGWELQATVFVCVRGSLWLKAAITIAWQGCVSTCLSNAWLQGKHFYLVLKKALHTHCVAAHTMSSLYSLISH